MDEKQRDELVQRAVRGDPDALQRLIVEYDRELRAALSRQIGADLQRHFDVDDVLQNTYCSLPTALLDLKLDNAAAYYVWLKRAAENDLRDMIRAAKAGKRGSLRVSLADFLTEVAASDSTPSRLLGREELHAAALSSLARLSPDHRQVIELRVRSRIPSAEVAQRMGRTPQAIDQLLCRALEKLSGHIGSITHYVSRL